MTVLRGMTWAGVVYNLFAKEQTPLDVVGRQERSAAIEHNLEFREKMTTSDGEEHLSSKDKISMEVTEEEMLSKLILSVSELCDIGVHMGNQIQEQNDCIDRIEEKTIRVTDETLAVTLRTAHLTQSIANSSDEMVGMYQFRDEFTGFYLSVENTDLVLVSKEDLSTYFLCYKKLSTLYALQNAKTLKYLSSTPWGPIKCCGINFGRREECHLFNNDEQRGIYFLQANWGTGGWLKKNLTKIRNNDNGGFLNSVTSNLSDKNGILLLKAIIVNS